MSKSLPAATASAPTRKTRAPRRDESSRGGVGEPLEQLAGAEGLAGRFRLLGGVEDMPGFLAGLDVAVLCSHAEGMSNALLEYMVRRAGDVISRSELMAHVWDENYDGLSNIVDVYIRRLRSKLDADRSLRLLETVRGAGYRLRNPDNE